MEIPRILQKLFSPQKRGIAKKTNGIRILHAANHGTAKPTPNQNQLLPQWARRAKTPPDPVTDYEGKNMALPAL
jgi:hypothetical protein